MGVIACNRCVKGCSGVLQGGSCDVCDCCEVGDRGEGSEWDDVDD